MENAILFILVSNFVLFNNINAGFNNVQRFTLTVLADFLIIMVTRLKLNVFLQRY